MNTLLRLLRRYRNVLYFLLLECVALLLHTQFSYTQKARIGALMNGVEAYAEDRASAMRRYTDLEGENARLVKENIALRNAHERLRYMLSRQRLTDSSASGLPHRPRGEQYREPPPQPFHHRPWPGRWHT